MTASPGLSPKKKDFAALAAPPDPVRAAGPLF